MSYNRHKLLTQLPREEFYEFEPEGVPHYQAIENVLRDVKAAHDLGIPFEVKTVTKKAFCCGGNVNKGTVRGYLVTVGKLEDQGET